MGKTHCFLCPFFLVCVWGWCIRSWAKTTYEDDLELLILILPAPDAGIRGLSHCAQSKQALSHYARRLWDLCSLLGRIARACTAWECGSFLSPVHSQVVLGTVPILQMQNQRQREREGWSQGFVLNFSGGLA